MFYACCTFSCVTWDILHCLFRILECVMQFGVFTEEKSVRIKTEFEACMRKIRRQVLVFPFCWCTCCPLTFKNVLNKKCYFKVYSERLGLLIV